LVDSAKAGQFALTGFLGYVRGKNLDTGQNLYHMRLIGGQHGAFVLYRPDLRILIGAAYGPGQQTADVAVGRIFTLGVSALLPKTTP
jgi:hypothetical protein